MLLKFIVVQSYFCRPVSHYSNETLYNQTSYTPFVTSYSKDKGKQLPEIHGSSYEVYVTR